MSTATTTDCESCKGTGWVVVADGGAGTARPCDCRQPRTTRDLLARAGTWERYVDCTREAWEKWRGVWPERELEPWGKSKWTVTVWGLVGRGKTSLATAIFGERLRSARGRWCDVSETLAALKRGFQSGGYDEQLERLKTVPVLLLDDLRAEHSTDWSDSQLSHVLRFRDGRYLETILTFNAPEVRPGEPSPGLVAIDAVEPRLSSRLTEGIVIGLGGEDWRKASAMRSR